MTISSSTPSGTSPFSYQWIHDSNIIPGATTYTFTIESISCTDARAYSVIVSNTCGSFYCPCCHTYC